MNRLNKINSKYFLYIIILLLWFSSLNSCGGSIETYPIVTTPTDLRVENVSLNQITLSWNYSGTLDITAGFRIYRAGELIHWTGATFYTDTELIPNTNYCYRISSYNFWGESGRSNEACADTEPDLDPPDCPNNLTAVATTQNEVALEWSASYDNDRTSGYNVYRDGLFIKSVEETSTYDSGLSSDTLYCYTVTAQDVVGNESVCSDQVCVDTSWRTYIIDNGTVGGSNAIVIDSADKVHISYYDRANETLKYATNVSGSWMTYTVDDNGVGNDSSIAVDSGNKIHISYYDETNQARKYATNTSGSWDTFSIDSTGDSANQHSSIATDSLNRVHISYFDRNNNDLKYATNISGSWMTYIIDSDGYVGLYNSIVIDSADKVHISYYDRANETLKYATNVSGSWMTYIVDIETAEKPNHITVDSADKIRITYGANGNIKYATNVSGSWVTYVVIGDSPSYYSITIDSANMVHISYNTYYSRINYYYDLIYATNVSSEWTKYTIDSGNTGWNSSIAIDSSDKLHILKVSDKAIIV
jgi:predicted small secreted protein